MMGCPYVLIDVQVKINAPNNEAEGAHNLTGKNLV